MADALDLTGKILVAMPGMSDPRFARAVIFLCDHSPEGAMGLIVNKPAEGLRLGDVVENNEGSLNQTVAATPVYGGGPVETGRGFVLHSADYHSKLQTLSVSSDFSMTATADIFEDMATGNGPANFRLMLGYAGWGPGQLESELAHNGWLTVDADLDLVFHTADAKIWSAALDRIGIDPLGLSAKAGRA
ncbi:MAG: YqgE/AlgH family protein [Sulfitobacter sp.]